MATGISKQVMCDICGKYYAARGIKSHIRLFHHLKVSEVSKKIIQKTFEPTELSRNSTKVPKSGTSTKVDSYSGYDYPDLEKLRNERIEKEEIEHKNHFSKGGSLEEWNNRHESKLRKWYVRDENGNPVDRSFNTEKEALDFIKLRITNRHK